MAATIHPYSAPVSQDTQNERKAPAPVHPDIAFADIMLVGEQ